MDGDRIVERIRGFNRFYTGIIGALDASHLESGYSLTEARVLYELAARGRTTAGEIGKDLALDPGYLSRIVKRLRDEGLVSANAAGNDARRSMLALTAKGRQAFEPLNRAASLEVEKSLAALSDPQRKQLVFSMETIQTLLGSRSISENTIVLREPRPGDYGTIIGRQGVLYAQEYGWDITYEALVGEIVGKFGLKHNPKREKCWVAERDGGVVGSIFVVQRSRTIAQLRLLYVEPSARGAGIGRRLVDEIVNFSRAAGYKKVMLWTNSVLISARRIYEAAGFRLVSSEKHHSFGKDLVGQNWELKL